MFTQVEVIRDPHHNLQAQMEHPVNVWGGTYTLAELRDPIKDTGYWDKLVNLDPRFSSVYDGFIGMRYFSALIGRDVIPEQHGPFQAITVALPMLEAQKATPDLPQFPLELEDTFVAHHVQHDDHEGEEAYLRNSTKDVAHLNKTAQIRLDEFELWCKIHQELFGEAADLEIAKVREVNSLDFWDISERIGYYATALQFAFVARNKENLDTRSRNRLKQRCSEISFEHRTFLESHRATVAMVDTVLGQTTDVFRVMETWRDLNV